MIEIRNYVPSDAEELDKFLHDGIPGLCNQFTNITAVKDSKTVIGYGSIKIFCEAFMLLDSKLSKREKAEAFQKILQIGIIRSRDAGMEELFLISNDKSFTQILRNKYGFKAVPGELLMLDLSEEGYGKQESEED